jgi:hypothetical protein
MLAKALFALAVAFLIAAPTTSFAASCTLQQIVACERMGAPTLCQTHYCVPGRRTRFGPPYHCVLTNQLDGTQCSNTLGCMPFGACSAGTCQGPIYACAPQPNQPTTTTCLCSMFQCSALNRRTGKSLDASQVCTQQPTPPYVYLPL